MRILQCFFFLVRMSHRAIMLPTLEPRLTNPRFYTPHKSVLTNEALLVERELERVERVSSFLPFSRWISQG